MSIEALTWAMNLAPVPYDAGKPSPSCALVLIGLANHAGPDGTCAFPSVATLVRYTRLSERTVRYCMDRLEADKIIRPCDPTILAATVKRGDRRPKGWDLAIERMRTDLSADELEVIATSVPMLRGFIERANGVQQLQVAPRNEVQQLHPASPDGVQQLQLRGAAAAPEPYKNQKPEKKKEKAPCLDADFLIAHGVTEQHARDWLAVRKAKGAPLTQTAWDGIEREAALAGITPAEAVRIAATRNWQGFKASWDWQESAEPSTTGAGIGRTSQAGRPASLAEQAQRSESLYADLWGERGNA